MIARFLHSQSKSITFSANILAASSLASAVLGLFRNRLLAGIFGASHETDVYLAAFRIPDLVYGIFILGGISVAFLPLFSELFEKNKEEAWAFANNLLSILFFGLAAFSAFLALIAPFLLPLITPGFSAEQKELTVSLMRLMFLSPIFFGIASVFSGIVQYFDRFLAYALAPILYNLGIIFGIVLLTPRFGIWGAGLGVVFGALLYVLIQVPSALHSGFRLKFMFNLHDPMISKVWKLAIPRLPGAIGYHLNLMSMTALASLFSAGSITVFGFANDIQSFPINLIGVSFAIAAFPALSKAYVKSSIEEFRSHFTRALSEIVFLALPMATSLFLLRAQIIRLAYGVGKFSWEDTRLTAAVLGIFTLGVLFQALVPLLARAFFSAKNTKIPTLAGLFAVGFNLVLALGFLRFFSHQNPFSSAFVGLLHLQGIQDVRVLSLPLALMISGLCQWFLLMWMLSKKIHRLFQKEFFSDFFKSSLATLALGCTIFLSLRAFSAFFSLRTFNEVLFQTLFAMGAGGLAFLSVARLLQSPQLKNIFHSLKHQLHGT